MPRPRASRSPAMHNVWDTNTSLPLSLEDFESSPDLSHEPRSSRSRSRPSRRRLDASNVTNKTDDSQRNSWSPPAWRKAGTGWFRPQDLSVHQSRLASPSRRSLLEHDDDLSDDDGEDDGNDLDELEDVSSVAAEIPLPGSPTKGRSMSPERMQPVSAPAGRPIDPPDAGNGNSYIRFSVRADVQQRTAPIEDSILYFRNLYARITKSPSSLVTAILVAISAVYVFRALIQDPAAGPTPDLIKVAGLAKSFEPLMYYSENGHTQVVQLGDTGVAVWDLGESVRSTNMTSGPIIVQSLDELSGSLKSLALELTRFFARIDGDIDSILIVMEWAQRELTRIKTLPTSQLSTVFSNLHLVLSRVGVLENPTTGEQTSVGQLVQDLFGQTGPQITRSTLQRTFSEFLAVLEESINNELTASISLFAHFEAIDHQFLNLQRTVVRETDAQERQENEILSSLWSRVMGANAGRLKKFEKNKLLLSSLRDRTVENKHVLVDHNSRLLQLRSNLDVLRQKLVSPLVRSRNSSTLTVDEQIRGLEGTYTLLRDTREAQKARLYNLLNDASAAPRRVIARGEGPVAKE